MDMNSPQKYSKNHTSKCSKKSIRENREVSLTDVKTISTDITNNMCRIKCSNSSSSENSDGMHDKINYNPPKQGSPKVKPLTRSMSYDDVRLSLIEQNTQGRVSVHKTPRRVSNYYKYKYNADHVTSDDKNRKELLWTNKIEDVLNEWHSKCITSSAWHCKKAKKHKMRFYILGIPAAIIPMALAASSDFLGDDWKLLVVIAMIISGSLNIVSGFLNPGKRLESHLTFSSMYSELAIEITSELVKPQSHRQAADVFIQRIMDNYNSLNNRAPPS